MFYQVIKILSLLAKLEFFNLDTHEAFNDFCALVIVNPEFKKKRTFASKLSSTLSSTNYF
jgi:hypothetical protein